MLSNLLYLEKSYILNKNIKYSMALICGIKLYILKIIFCKCFFFIENIIFFIFHKLYLIQKNDFLRKL